MKAYYGTYPASYGVAHEGVQSGKHELLLNRIKFRLSGGRNLPSPTGSSGRKCKSETGGYDTNRGSNLWDAVD